jgi:flagellar basal-body rod protein FlgG
MLGSGVATVATQKIHTQGGLVQTENTFDLAVNGKGFFQILRPDGSTSYTRDGAFQVNGTGQVVNSNGYTLVPAITVPSNSVSVTIGSDGTVSSLTAGSVTPTQLGIIQISDFINPSGLQPIGENQFVETASSGAPLVVNPGTQGAGSLIQGSLEGSNVNVVEELVKMIETQRAYEMNAKSVETVDQMLQFITQVL